MSLYVAKSKSPGAHHSKAVDRVMSRAGVTRAAGLLLGGPALVRTLVT